VCRTITDIKIDISVRQMSRLIIVATSAGRSCHCGGIEWGLMVVSRENWKALGNLLNINDIVINADCHSDSAHRIYKGSHIIDNDPHRETVKFIRRINRNHFLDDLENEIDNVISHYEERVSRHEAYNECKEIKKTNRKHKCPNCMLYVREEPGDRLVSIGNHEKIGRLIKCIKEDRIFRLSDECARCCSDTYEHPIYCPYLESPCSILNTDHECEVIVGCSDCKEINIGYLCSTCKEEGVDTYLCESCCLSLSCHNCDKNMCMDHIETDATICGCQEYRLCNTCHTETCEK
jgi:hypothetical protein